MAYLSLRYFGVVASVSAGSGIAASPLFVYPHGRLTLRPGGVNAGSGTSLGGMLRAATGSGPIPRRRQTADPQVRSSVTRLSATGSGPARAEHLPRPSS